MTWLTAKYIAVFAKAYLVYLFVIIIIITSLTIAVHSIVASNQQYGGNSL